MANVPCRTLGVGRMSEPALRQLHVVETPFYIPATDSPSRPRRTLKHGDTFAVFDDHGESHVFLSPAGGMFDRIVEEMTRANGEASAESGHVWLVSRQEAYPACEAVVFTTVGPKVVSTLGELLDGLQQLGQAGRPDVAAGAEVQLLG